jgi:hypothetical protein
MAKQTSIPKIDEEFMKEVISRGFPMNRENLKEITNTVLVNEEKTTVENSKPKETEKRKRERAEHSDYLIYFEKVDLMDRQPLYVTRETHLTLTNLVNTIGGRNANIGSYAENIIRHHLESNKDEINSLYNEATVKKPIP